MYPVIDEKSAPKVFTFIDFETANLGLHHSLNLPWEVSVLETDGHNKIHNSFQTYINWPEGLRVSDTAAEKTGYSESVVKEQGIHPVEAYSIIYPLIEKADHICGHNIIGIDIYMWKALCEKIGAKYINFIPKAIDTASIAKGVKLDIFPKNGDDFLPWQYRMRHTKKKGLKFSLESLGKEYGIEHDYSTLHSALSDVELNFKVWKQLKYNLKF